MVAKQPWSVFETVTFPHTVVSESLAQEILEALSLMSLETYTWSERELFPQASCPGLWVGSVVLIEV